MIYHNDKEITSVRYRGRFITFIYRGAYLIWQAVSSCFGAGYWIDEYPWKNEDAWKNND